ncbi:MAG: MBL fold metallo-hydrolase [Nitrospinota bacterium]|nr:MBL fold metallo-hydrolase [Nitrospinota bacterium]
MELFLIGTGTCSPVKDRTPACYFLRAGTSRIIIDPGPGAVHRIAQRGLDAMDVDAIFLSHHHLDHSADVAPWLFSYKYCLEPDSAQSAQPRRDPLIVAPEGFGKVYEGLVDTYGKMLLSDDYKVRIEEVNRTEWQWPGGLSFRSIPMLHFIPSVGYLFKKHDGPALAYSGDTGFCEELVELASMADALLVECSLPDERRMEGHMTPSDIARVGIESGVKKLILTHFYPMMNPQAAVETIRAAGYPGEIIAGEDGMMAQI